MVVGQVGGEKLKGSMIDFIAPKPNWSPLTQDRGNAPVIVMLTQTEIRWHADGYSETAETIVDEHSFHVPLPAANRERGWECDTCEGPLTR